MDTSTNFKTLEKDLNELAERVASADIDPTSRIALQKAAQKLSLALETTGDSFQRIAFLPLQSTVVRIGLDLDLFKKLDKAGSQGTTLERLAKETEADPVLLNRLLRYLVVTGVIDQKGETEYVANTITKGLCTPVSDAGVRHYYDFVSPIFFKLPAYLVKTKYQNPDDEFDGPFQYAYGTKLHASAWFALPEHAQVAQNFSTWLVGSHEGRADWLDWFPLKDVVGTGIDDCGPDAVSFVDVGGNQGSELNRLHEKYPELLGRLVLQDVESVIKDVPAGEPFEVTVHDFFTPQPIQGARVYYFRNVLHDWSDEKCRDILKNTITAMKRGFSKIILNEMVVKDEGAGWTETQWDLTMMACASAKERTEAQWRDLIGSVGLKLVKIWRNMRAVETIIEVELA